MTGAGRQLSSAAITSETVKNIAVYLVAYAAIGLLATITIGPIGLLQGLFGGLSFLYVPSIAAIVLLCISSLAGLLLAGRMAGPISRSVMTLALVSFISIIAYTQSAVPGLNGLAIPLFLAGTTYALTILAAPVSDLAKTLSSAIFAVAAGFLALVAPALMGLPDGVVMGWILFTGFIVTAATTLPGVFHRHSNEYLAIAGGYFGRREIPWVLGVLCIFLLGYDQYVRPTLVSAAPLGISALEWGIAIIVLISAGLRALEFVRSVSREREPGNLRSLVQHIAYDRSSLESAHAAVESFVAEGKKESLIVYVMTAMLENEAPPKVIEGVLSMIVGYSDEPEPIIALKWVRGDVAGKNRARRLALAGELVAATSAAIGRSHIAEEPVALIITDHSGGM